MMRYPFTHLLFWLARVYLWMCIAVQILNLLASAGWVLVLTKRGYRA